MAVTNMGRNNYVHKPGPFETAIINKLSRYFTNEEFILDPAAPEAIILEVLNRVLPVIKTTARVTVTQLAQGVYQPEDIEAVLYELQSIRKELSNNQEAIGSIQSKITELEQAIGKLFEEPEDPGDPE